MLIEGYRDEGGLVVPAWDFKIGRYLRESLSQADLAISHCQRRDVVVQAGGNCGLWAKHLSGLFGAVYTFEPDPANFFALAFNTYGLSNVIRLQAALGDRHACVDMNRSVKNCGAYYVEGGGLLPVLRIDDLGLPACDLIYLDVEGSELAALRGAVDTIEQFSPVIAFEDKGLGKRFGVEQGAVEKWLTDVLSYKTVAKDNHDTVMVRA